MYTGDMFITKQYPWTHLYEAPNARAVPNLSSYVTVVMMQSLPSGMKA